MIQRKQTIYLLLVFVFSMLLNWINPAFYTANGKIAGKEPPGGSVEVGYSATLLTEDGATQKAANTLLSSTVLIIALVSLVCIFLFKNRKWQMILTLINMLFMLSLPVIMYYYSFNIDYFVDGTGQKSLTGWAFMPVALLIFSYLAYNGIKKDDQLIRSVDRLR